VQRGGRRVDVRGDQPVAAKCGDAAGQGIGLAVEHVDAVGVQSRGERGAQAASGEDGANARSSGCRPRRAAPRRESYVHLLAVINGRPAPPDSLAPVFDWLLRALRARTPE
jgi:hypothetical protein